MATVYQGLQPGFVIRVQQGSIVTPNFTVKDRGGNVLNLTGYTVKLAAQISPLQSNGQGQLVPTLIKLFDVQATLLDFVNGNLQFPFGISQTGMAGNFQASLRLWVNATVARPPDDAYVGAFLVDPAVVREEA